MSILAVAAAGLSLIGTVILSVHSNQQDQDIKAAAVERREQIIVAGERSVRIGCVDANRLRREQRLTILEARPRLRQLLAEGAITQGLYREAFRQGDRRLARLGPRDCDRRAAAFRETALNGR